MFLSNAFAIGKLGGSEDIMKSSDNDTLDKTQRSVQSIEVGGRLLLVLAECRSPMSLKDLAARAGLSASRAHPYLVSFGKLRLIEQDRSSGHYALGPAALQLGLTCLAQLDPLKVATPIAERLAESTGLAVALAVWGNFGPTVVRMIDARQPLHVSMRSGTVMSIFGTATGRAFAALLPVQQLQQATGGALGDAAPLASAPSIADRAGELQEIAAEMRQHGVVRAVGRPMPGVNAFSAAAFDHEGTPVLVVTVLGHHDHVSADWDSAAARAVRLAAAEISRGLGWHARPVGAAAAPLSG